MSRLKSEEYTRSLPNSRWLRSIMEYKKEVSKESLTDKEWQKAVKVEDSYLETMDIDLEMSTNILVQCVMVAEGKPIYLSNGIGYTTISSTLIGI